jgi:hypothetical protein
MTGIRPDFISAVLKSARSAHLYLGTSVAQLSDVPNQQVEAFMTPERPSAAADVVRRVQCEFLEMPGLRLTAPQARRLWGLDAAACDALLDSLVSSNFLFRTRDGAFMRVDQATPAKASLTSNRPARIA